MQAATGQTNLATGQTNLESAVDASGAGGLVRFIRIFEAYGDAPALSLGASVMTYAGLAASARQWATAFSTNGVHGGDRVAILQTPGPEWAAAFFGVVAAGAVAVPLAPEASLDELATQLRIAEVSCIAASRTEFDKAATLCARTGQGKPLCMPRCADSMQGGADLAPVRGCDPAVIAFTSGTSGDPKGVVITHDNLLFQLRAFRTIVPTAPRRTVSLLPWHHLFGLTVDLLACLSRGTHIAVCPSRLPGDIAATMAWQKPQCMVVVPAFLEALRRRLEAAIGGRRGVRHAMKMLARLPRPVRRLLARKVHRELGGRLETLIAGGAPLNRDTARILRTLGFRVAQGYGMTEASPVIAIERIEHADGETVGHPLPGVDLVIDAEGQVLTRGPHVMAGYFRDAAASHAVIDSQGWLHTGDLGHLDRRGRLVIDGRTKNVIVLASGENVAAEEVERALAASKCLEECAVIGVPSSACGEEVAVAVVPIPEIAELEPKERHAVLTQAVARAAAELAPFKMPTRIVVSESPLPRTLTGKVRRAEVTRFAIEELVR